MLMVCGFEAGARSGADREKGEEKGEREGGERKRGRPMPMHAFNAHPRVRNGPK